MNLFLRAYRLLTPAERRQAWLILFLVIVVALFQMIATVSVMPFLAVISNTKLIETNRTLAFVHDLFGFTETRSFLIFLGAGSFTLLMLSAVVRVVGQFLVIRFTQLRAFSIGRRLFEVYLRQPYAYFLAHHTGDMSKGLLSEVQMLISQVYTPLTTLISQGILMLALIGVLLMINPMGALVGMSVLGLCYGIVYLTVRQRLDRIGKQRVATNKQRFRLVAEALGGIKTVKLLGREPDYLDRFGDSAFHLARFQSTSAALSMVPRYAIEAIAFGGIILLTLTIILQHGGEGDEALGEVLPLLGLYAFAGYRILPAIQSVYAALAQLRFGVAILDTISEELAGHDTLPALNRRVPTPLPFRDAIELDDVGFRHDGATTSSLDGVSLKIGHGSTLGIVGATGAGKTTMVDLFLGLLQPSSGEIRVDGVAVSQDNLRDWQANLGYVPQDIFLLDASVARNIAFGVKPREVDMDKVRHCAEMAQLRDFVETELPQGFDTLVGERGVRLSGGQRQRIGIARALYTDPDILVFDEATSALDNVTEKAVVAAIDALTGTKTILIIAHRMSTVRNCDQILVLDHGRIAGLGTYDDLYAGNTAFQNLVDAREAA